ncbi:MAG: LmbE family N-acetylglucosaminyl deacetylase [Arenicella sp.]|jgi:LmbE family N-acetylglucosaminyl deacetylase
MVKAVGSCPYKPVNDKHITYMVNVRAQIEQRIGAMKAHASQFDEQTIGQMRSLGTASAIEGFVEARNLSVSATLATIFAKGDEDQRG